MSRGAGNRYLKELALSASRFPIKLKRETSAMWPTIYSLIFALFVIACLASGIWLMLHLNALSSLFRGRADIAPGRLPPKVSREQTRAVFAVFMVGLIGVLAMQALAITA